MGSGERDDKLRAELTEAQHQLVESAKRIRAILETVVDGIITIDERGIIDSFNPAATRIFGYGPTKWWAAT